jgi:hypothetical protein
LFHTKNEKIYKKLWSKWDTEFYQQELRNLKSIIKPNTSSEVKLDILMKQLKKADEIAVPNTYRYNDAITYKGDKTDIKLELKCTTKRKCRVLRTTTKNIVALAVAEHFWLSWL